MESRMKKSVFALSALSALLLAACGDSSNDSPATRAEKCAASPKVTKACLEGTWKLDHFEGGDGSKIEEAFDRVGGSLKFAVSNAASNTAEEPFSYATAREDMTVSCPAGKWTLAADSASFASLSCVDWNADVGAAAVVMRGTDTLVVSKSPFEKYVTTYVDVVNEVYVIQE